MAAETWTFQTEFNVSRDVLEQQKVDLLLSGVDTIAEVYVNDEKIGALNNAHRSDARSCLIAPCGLWK